jgi:hypothetical protein
MIAPRFYPWVAVLFVLAVLANLPHRWGLGMIFYTAGFPYPFLSGGHGKFEQFHAEGLAIDLAIWTAVVVLLPAALSRRMQKEHSSTLPHTSLESDQARDGSA